MLALPVALKAAVSRNHSVPAGSQLSSWANLQDTLDSIQETRVALWLPLSRTMSFRAAWSLVLRKGGLGIRGIHSPGGTAHGKEKMPPYTNYHAQRSYPMPDEPFRTELNAEQQALKEKEKGSWTQLSHAEKVALYRLQFHETFTEMNRRSNEWKTVMGCVFFFFGFTGLLIWWQRVYVFPKKPITLMDEWKAQQLQRILDMKGNPVQGLASRWDYERKEWKK
ncbi:cytochrome c oxidase subunit 4 isoform 2, mitochondrial isoform X3 [Physeter macrocephalus]|uniref:Cytochrome c oxidase subunit 4 n=1 Tax=Physeter macrocephalus TaxID=9755 RepID=A0A455CB46_PHYMC|nr:cytochrome c oxidase subunit 4 isoform 2, mitochondrial isoform X3 [Physeter catodon]|eukprot:XP_028355796.1 cytochrome c oxidase subunit 4 isoform 2, mitochondrial isoform X4 [Physeter catodon]